jgi:hypothetical protein
MTASSVITKSWYADASGSRGCAEVIAADAVVGVGVLGTVVEHPVFAAVKPRALTSSGTVMSRSRRRNVSCIVVSFWAGFGDRRQTRVARNDIVGADTLAVSQHSWVTTSPTTPVGAKSPGTSADDRVLSTGTSPRRCVRAR